MYAAVSTSTAAVIARVVVIARVAYAIKKVIHFVDNVRKHCCLKQATTNTSTSASTSTSTRRARHDGVAYLWAALRRTRNNMNKVLR